MHTAAILLQWIAEVADEPLALEPADRQVERETNTWCPSVADGDRESLSVAEVVAAFERTAAALRGRVRGLGFTGAATFYVWHDEQAGQLRCSTGSVPPEALPFGRGYVTCTDLGPVVEGFLTGGGPRIAAGADLEEAERGTEGIAPGPDPQCAPLPVWVSGVGAAP
ncbi:MULTISPECIES: hypothetical protein [Streptomyces]|uniref:Uncharacterized protein n=1 Tax=Streptomyces spororaveus TaxID=284039 RepID=A0ABQ3TPU4_9ACTN|nr:hypothetical protein [Streptomyces spororaveus]GHI82037.1 hypothetical protein Sspor_75980 [Streptomyces spororaveus]